MPTTTQEKHHEDCNTDKCFLTPKKCREFPMPSFSAKALEKSTINMTPIKLQPCSFCAGEGRIIDNGNVICDECQSCVPNVETWNRRTWVVRWTANYGFPHYKTVGRLFKKEVPNGWRVAGQVYWGKEQSDVHCLFCGDILHIGIEDGKSFKFCAREMRKVE